MTSRAEALEKAYAALDSLATLQDDIAERQRRKLLDPEPWQPRETAMPATASAPSEGEPAAAEVFSEAQQEVLAEIVAEVFGEFRTEITTLRAEVMTLRKRLSRKHRRKAGRAAAS